MVIAGACLGVLVLIIVLIALVSKKKSSLSPHFIDEDNSHHTPKFKSLTSHGSAQELRVDFGNDYKGIRHISTYLVWQVTDNDELIYGRWEIWRFG